MKMEKMHPIVSPRTSTLNPPSDPSKEARIMENLKAAVLLRISTTHPNLALSSSQIAAMEHGLKQAFSSLRTPTHPTYASMIQDAISNLYEEGGSTESSISEYIMEKYDGLPWAHKRFLSYYLNKLCESGEVICSSSKCYTLPGLSHKPKSKKKLFRSNSGRKRKENVIGEGSLGREELIGVNENEVCFQEDETQVFVNNRVKRRRGNLIVHEEDEELKATEVLGGEDNMNVSNAIQVIEGKNELSLDHGTDYRGNNVIVMGQDLAQMQPVVGGVGDCELETVLIESKVEKLMPTEGQGDAVRTNDPSKERTVEKCLSVEGEDEVGTKILPLNHESCDANLMLIPIDSAEKPALKERDHSGSTAAELMIVPFMGDTVVPVVSNEMKPVLKERVEIIVCGLPSQVAMSSNRKPIVYRPKKRFKQQEKKALLLLDKHVPAPLQTGLETKLKQKLQLEPSLFSSPQELMTIDDDDLNIPLQRVVQKCSKQRKLSEQLTISKGPLASLLCTSAAKQQAEIPGSDSDGKFMLQRNKDFTRTKRKQKQGQQLRSQGQKCDNYEIDIAAAPESEVFSSFQLNVGCDNGKERCDNQEPQLADAACDKYSVEHRHEPGGGKNQGSGPYAEPMSEALPLDGQCHEFAVNQWKMGDHSLPNEVKQTPKVGLRNSSLPQNQNGQREEHTQQKQTEIDGVVFCDSTYDKIHDQQGQDEFGVGLQDPEPHISTHLEVKTQISDQRSQKKSKQVKRERRGRPRKQREETKDVEDSLNSHHLEQEGRAGSASNQHSEKQNKQLKKDGRGRPRKHKVEENLAAPPNMHDQLLEKSSEPGIQLNKKDGQGSPRKLTDETTGKVDTPLNSHDLKQDGPSGLATLSPSLRQSKERKRDGRGRPRKQSVAVKGEGLSGPETGQPSQQRNKQPRRDGRGRPRKQKEAANEDVTASLNLHHLQEERLSEADNPQHSQLESKQPKDYECGKPPKQSGATEEGAVVEVHGNLDQQLQEGPSKKTLENELPKIDGCGSPPKKNRTFKDDVAAPLSLIQQQQEELSKPPTNQLQNKQKRDGCGRPSKKDAAINEDSNLHHEQLEGPSELAAEQHLPQQNKQLKENFHGRLRELNGASKENEATLLSQHQEQPIMAVQSPVEASVVFCNLDQKEGQQQQTDCQQTEVTATSEGPLALGHQSIPAPVLEEYESLQQGKMQKSLEEGKQLCFLDEQVGKSHDQAHGMPSCQEQESVLSVNGTPEQLEEQKEHGECQLSRSNQPLIEPVVDQPSQQQEEEQFQFHMEKQEQSIDLEKTPKQKSAKTKAMEVPLSSIDKLRSRIKRHET